MKFGMMTISVVFVQKCKEPDFHSIVRVRETEIVHFVHFSSFGRSFA